MKDTITKLSPIAKAFREGKPIDEALRRAAAFAKKQGELHKHLSKRTVQKRAA